MNIHIHAIDWVVSYLAPSVENAMCRRPIVGLLVNSREKTAPECVGSQTSFFSASAAVLTKRALLERGRVTDVLRGWKRKERRLLILRVSQRPKTASGSDERWCNHPWLVDTSSTPAFLP